MIRGLGSEEGIQPMSMYDMQLMYNVVHVIIKLDVPFHTKMNRNVYCNDSFLQSRVNHSSKLKTHIYFLHIRQSAVWVASRAAISRKLTFGLLPLKTRVYER